MTRVVGVRWRELDPVSYAIAGDFSLPMKSYVILQLEKSQEIAWVCREAAKTVDCEPGEEPKINVIRKSTRPSAPKVTTMRVRSKV